MTNALAHTIDQAITAFIGHRRLSAGPLMEVALAVFNAADISPLETVLVFDDANGRVIDLDLHGDKASVIARLSVQYPAHKPPAASVAGEAGKHGHPQETASPPAPARRGRPRLGVVAREVTLLPRHWTWLSQQSGGASAALRRLVDQARKAESDVGPNRHSIEAAYRFMSAIGGNLAGFEEASRALFAHDRERLESHTATWPRDIQTYLFKLLDGDSR